MRTTIKAATTTTAAAITIAMIASASPATAATIDTDNTPNISSTQNSSPELSNATINRYDDYISFNGKEYAAEIPRVFEILDPEGVAAVRQALVTTNATLPELSNMTHTLAAAHGGYTRHWWGIEIWMDELLTQKVEGVLNQGGGLSGLAALFKKFGVLGLPAAALSLILWFRAGQMQAIDDGKGVIFHVIWGGANWFTAR